MPPLSAQAANPLLKAMAAQEHGAVGILFVDDVHNHPGEANFEAAARNYWPEQPPRIESFALAGWMENVRIPAAQIPNVVSQGSVDIEDAQATRRGVSLSLGLFGFTFWVAPVFDIHIGKLTLSDVIAAASIESLRLEDVSAPVTIRGVRMGDLQLEQLTVNQVSI